MALRLPADADVDAAAARLDGIAHRTPVMTSRTMDEATGGRLFFKCENLQRTGSFKFRGAYNAIACLDAAQRRAGVLTYSSGNHGQAIALAARLLGARATIVMPHDAPATKRAATESYGGEVVTYDRYAEDREEIAATLERQRGMTLIPPYDHPDVIAGQGTATKELLEDTGSLDLLVVCLGGGGLLAGAALAAARHGPGCRVVGVEPDAGNDGQRSLKAGEIVHIAPPRTLADGAATTHLGAHTFPIIRRHVADIVTVSDAQLTTQVRMFAERMKLVAEPTGCLAAAAVLHGIIGVQGLRTGIVISGGNIDPPHLAALLV